MNVNEHGRIDLEALKFVPKEEADRDERWLLKGDVLFNNTNSPELVGKTALYDLDEPRAFSNHMTRIRFREGAIPQYWAMLLHQLWREKFFEGTCNNHVSQASVSRTALSELTIQLPPTAEQSRIVAALRPTLAKVSSARERLERVSRTIKRFRQSVLAAACSGRLTEKWRAAQHSETADSPDYLPPAWRIVKVSEVIECLKYGTSKKCGHDTKGVPVLRIPNIGDGSIRHDDMKYAELDPSESEQLRLQSGDLLMIRSNGSVSLLGKTALVGKAEVGFAYAGYLIRIRPNVAMVHPPYLNAVLASEGIRNQIELPARSTSGVNNINSEEVRTLGLPLPPADEQKEIVRCVSAFFVLADAIEERAQSALRRVEFLTQAIVAKAFRGELVPTEAELARREKRSYEPASELLARLSATMNGATREKGTRKKMGQKGKGSFRSDGARDATSSGG